MSGRAHKHTKRNTMNVILILCGIFLLVYTAVMIWLYLRMGTEMTTLTTCVFAAVAGECGIMGWIKTAKVRNQEKQWEREEKDNAEMGNERV